jgi:hypothetical protein
MLPRLRPPLPWSRQEQKCPCSYFHSPSLAGLLPVIHAQFLSAAIGSHRSILMEALTSSSILESPHAANQLSISANRIRQGAACTDAFIRPHISLSRSISRSSLLRFLLLCIVSFPFSSSCSFTCFLLPRRLAMKLATAIRL